MIRMGRRRRRSTHAPAGRPNRMNGRNSKVPSSPTSNAFAFNSKMAISGSPSSVTWVPSWLIVSAVHSFRKSGWRHKLRGAGRNRGFEPAAAGEPSPLSTGLAPSGRGAALRSLVEGPRDRHERRVDALGPLRRLLALLVRLPHLLDLRPDPHQRRRG